MANPKSSKPAPKPAQPAKPAASKQAAPAAAEAPKRSVPRSPSVDLKSLVVERGVARTGGTSRSEWVGVLSQLEYKDDSVFVPERKPGQLSYVKKAAEKLSIAISMESAVREGVDGTRIFRDNGPLNPELVDEPEEDDSEGDDEEDDGLE